MTARKLQALRAASVSALGEIGDEHRFLHGRVELFVRILLAFLVLSTLGGIPKVLFVAPAVPNYRGAIWVTNAITAGYTLALAIVWWRVRRARDSAWALRAAEAAGTVVLGMVVASFAPIVPPSFPYLLLMQAFPHKTFTRSRI